MAPEETHYLGIAAAIGVLVPLGLVAYAYFFVTTSLAQKAAVEASREHVRILDIKPRMRDTSAPEEPKEILRNLVYSRYG